MSGLRTLTVWGLLIGVLLWPGSEAHARSTYFDNFTALYGISEGDNLNACGVCHFLWEGPGARNLFGSEVEQQLYLGKTILRSLQDVEGNDSDSDGFTNLAEIVTFQTLPGYNCDNFFEAVSAPLDYHTYITPGVASCLEPLDIRVSPTTIPVFADVGDVKTAPLTIFNNGIDFPLTIFSYALLPGSHPAYSLEGPNTPLDIPVGEKTTVDIVFAPLAPALASGTLRISSNDPNEGELDVPISGLAVIHPVASAGDRALCLSEVDKQYRRYSKKHFREWERCYLAEVTGVACDTGRRDLKLQQAETKLRDAIGGSKDKRCLGNGLTPSLLDFPQDCGGACGHIDLNSIAALAECLICRQQEALQDALAAAMGTAPPDLPPNTLTGSAAKCQDKLIGAVSKGIGKIHKELGECELENITSGAPVDCATNRAALIAKVQEKVDSRIDQCKDASGLLGCLFDDPNNADPSCLGNATLSIGSDLVETSFGLEE
ncbi:MAG: hypothetical protein E2O73_16405 [Deltaproteobacteria bacterium]|nr:MAG: hypothetical protein E2O73_16405 [Deltaproteobacteria bacterium]